MKFPKCFSALSTLLLVLGVVLPISAVSTVFWRSATYQEFSEGTLNDVSLSRDGRLSLAPSLTEIFHTDQALVWAVTADSAGNVYLASGHRGRLYRLTPQMLASSNPIAQDKALFYTMPEPEVFALCVGPDGAIYAGTSPDGKVYRIDSGGHGAVYFDPKTKYIWSLAFLDNALYVGSGDHGDIYRVTAANTGAKFFDTQQRQVMALLADRHGNLLAGTEPNGLIFRITPAGKGFVLYNSPLQEIHRLALGSDGAIYATAQGAAGRGGLSAEAAELSASDVAEAADGTGGVTVTLQADSGGDMAAQSATSTLGGAVTLQAPGQSPTPSTPRVKPSSPIEQLFQRIRASGAASGRGIKSAVYRIALDDSVDTLWTSRTEDANDILPGGAALLFSTDSKGRIYELNGARETTLLVQTNQEEATRLIRVGPYILATTSNFGNLYRLGSTPAASGWFESAVKDTHGISHWGNLSWRGTFPGGARVEMFTRSGNSSRPDRTWSDWSPAHRHSDERIESPAARYIQWKAVLYSSAAASPVLDEVTVPYLPANQAPEITSLRARTAGDDGDAASDAGGPDSAASVSLLGAKPAGVLPTQRPRGIRLTWRANDPDNDTLRYYVYFQGEGESSWKLLKKDLTGTSFNVTSDLLPDGTYKFKVVASDEESNPPGVAKTAEMISAPATLDTTPPQVTVQGSETPGSGTAVVRFSARDSVSVLTRAEYSIDVGPWRPLYSDDGIIDSRTETFTVRGEHLSPGEHLFVLRVYDSSGNQSSTKAVVITK